MSLIVGVKCQDGIALGADGACTATSMGQPLMRQTYRKKLILAGSQAVVGSAGPIGIGQRFAEEVSLVQKFGIRVDGVNQPRLLHKSSPADVMGHLRQIHWEMTSRELDIARSTSQLLGDSAALRNTLS